MKAIQPADYPKCTEPVLLFTDGVDRGIRNIKLCCFGYGAESLNGRDMIDLSFYEGRVSVEERHTHQ